VTTRAFPTRSKGPRGRASLELNLLGMGSCPARQSRESGGGWTVATSLRASLALDALEMPSGPGANPSTGWSITATGACSHCLHRAIGRGGQRSPRSAHAATATTAMMIGLYKSELIFNRGRGAPSKTPSWPPLPGSTGGRRRGCAPPSATSHRRSSRPSLRSTPAGQGGRRPLIESPPSPRRFRAAG
jgi:hypothetical protein